MDDFKLDIEVKVVAKPLSPKLGEEKRGPYERNQFVVRDYRTSHYVGDKGDIATLAANAAKAISRQWALSSNEPPQVLIEDATPYATTATLRGKINAHGVATTITFEYGTTMALGTSATANQSTNANTYWINANKGISGLTAETTYYYRVKAVSGGVTVYSKIRKFTTKEAGTTSTSTTTTSTTTTTTA